jgi:phage terminase large subunit GpA-like protein
MEWENVKWPDSKPDQAAYHCDSCDNKWSERQRLRAIQQGSYEAQMPFNGHAGFLVNKLASPWEPLSVLAQKYLDSKDKPEQLKTFMNTQLARTYKEAADVPDWKKLYRRREDYKRNVIPEDAVFLTAGVDIQGDRMELEIIAWGERKVSWSIDYRVIEGAPTEEETWKKFDEVVYESFPIGDTGRFRSIDKICIDSGYATSDVYYFTARYSRQRVVCVKGHDTFDSVISVPKPVDVNRAGKIKKNGNRVCKVGSSYLKGELYGWLKSELPVAEDAPTPYGYRHFPMYGEEYFKMLTAEELQTKVVNGYPRRFWVKTRNRNEALDTAIYARAAASLCGIDRLTREQINMLNSKRKVSPPVKKAEIAKKTENKNEIKPRKRRKSSWL